MEKFLVITSVAKEIVLQSHSETWHIYLLPMMSRQCYPLVDDYVAAHVADHTKHEVLVSLFLLKHPLDDVIVSKSTDAVHIIIILSHIIIIISYVIILCTCTMQPLHSVFRCRSLATCHICHFYVKAPLII